MIPLGAHGTLVKLLSEDVAALDHQRHVVITECNRVIDKVPEGEADCAVADFAARIKRIAMSNPKALQALTRGLGDG